MDEGAYKALHVPFDNRIPKLYSKGYQVKQGNDQLQFIPVNARSVIGSVYDTQTILYQNAWDQVDVTLSITDTGIKETLILNTADAPNTFLFEVIGNMDEQLNSANFQLQPAWLEDSQGEFRYVEQKMIIMKGKQYIQLTADVSQLSYPVKIDPTVTIKDSFQDVSYNLSCSDCDGIGSYLTPVLKVSPVNNELTDAYIRFGLNQIPTNSIRSAILNMYVVGGKDKYSYFLKIRRITSDWNQTTINKITQLPTVTTDYLTGETGRYGWNDWDGYSEGWSHLDITNYVQQWLNGVPNYGIRIELDMDVGNPQYKYFASSEYNLSDKRPNLVIDYNLTPSTPQVISPNGGDNIDGAYSILWSGSSDDYTTQPHLKYDLEYSTNGGTTWARIVSALEGQTSFTYDFSSASPSISALVRVRSYDGMVYSPWDQSDAPFTIQHNRAPNAPSGLTPGNTSSATPTLVAGVTPTLKWSFTDPDAGDTQSAYNVLIYNSSNALIRDFGWVNSSSNTFTVPSGILNRVTVYSWKVFVKDSKGAVSPASASMYIKTNALPTLTMTSYADGEKLTINAPTLTWTYTDADGQTQAAFQVQGSKDNFATIAYNSGTINKADKSHTTTQLSSGIWSFRVMVWDGVEWSAYATRKLELPNNYEPNDSFATASSIQSVDTILSEIGAAGDVDFYKFTTTSNGYYKVTLSSAANLNYDVYVYDASQNLIDAGVQGANVTDNLMFAVNESSVYYIKVIELNNTYSATAKYGLRVLPLQLSSQTNYTYDNNGNLQSKVTTYSEATSGQPAKYTTYDGTVKTAINTSNVNVTAGGKNTVEFWMKWDGTDDRMPFSWGTAYDLWFNNNAFGFNTGEGNVLGIDASPLKGQWVHVAAVFYNGVPNASNSEIYINGKKQVLTQRVGQTTVSKAVSTQAFIGGWGADESHKFKGSIGGLHIWNRALSGFEIQNNLYRVYLGDESGLVYSQP